MNDNEIAELLADNEKYELPRVIIHREFAIGLVNSRDPMFLNRIPQPFRDGVIELGLSIEDQWYEVSNNGTVDFSKYAEPLADLVKQYLENVPIGEYINFKHSKRT